VSGLRLTGDDLTDTALGRGAEPDVPDYGTGSLADVLPSVLAGLGVAGGADRLGLGPSRSVCVLLVDGLGDDLLAEHAAAAPFLASLRADGGRRITAGFPATTTASLTSLGTGLPPGEHGVVGYEVWLDDIDGLLNCLHWDPRVDPHVFQPEPTVFELADRAGVAVAQVGPGRFAGTGLTEAALRGGAYLGAETAGQRVAAAADALRGDEPRLVYAYYGDLDTTGHVDGATSPAWRYQLQAVDLFAEQLAGALPSGARLVVTADHGMLDVPHSARVDLAEGPELDQGVAHVAGEPRAVYVHALPGAAEDVLAAWRETLGDRFWVRTRDEAIAAGWFGPVVTDAARARIGDVIAAARTASAVVDSRRMSPHLLRLVGLHGSLTPAELGVPLLVHDADDGGR
jgi:type I phosphodiesterase/nucleotide pyrophosphatase